MLKNQIIIYVIKLHVAYVKCKCSQLIIMRCGPTFKVSVSIRIIPQTDTCISKMLRQQTKNTIIHMCHVIKKVLSIILNEST